MSDTELENMSADEYRALETERLLKELRETLNEWKTEFSKCLKQDN